jgi:hypothetical protein
MAIVVWTCDFFQASATVVDDLFFGYVSNTLLPEVEKK